MPLISAMITTLRGPDARVNSRIQHIAGEALTRMSGIPKEVRERIKAVVFDLDDTLVQSTVDFAKFKVMVIEKIASHGEDRRLYSPNETVVAIVARYEDRMRSLGVKEPEIRRRLAELDRIMDEVELEGVNETLAIDGAAELLGYLRRRGVKIGILTRGCEAYAKVALTRTHLLDLADAIECRNSDTKAKPDPEAYLKLVAALGVKKEESLFVGDHPIDAKCAANAGVPFIGVMSGDVPEELLRSAGAAEVLKDVSELLLWFRTDPAD